MYSENEWHQPVDRGPQTCFIVTKTLTQTIKYLQTMHQSNITIILNVKRDNFLKIQHMNTKTNKDNKENILG